LNHLIKVCKQERLIKLELTLVAGEDLPIWFEDADDLNVGTAQRLSKESRHMAMDQAHDGDTKARRLSIRIWLRLRLRVQH
jgi:hypothetical protein